VSPSAALVTLRPATAIDDELLRAVYAASRADELAPLGWSASQSEAFLRSQFDAQDRHYAAAFPLATRSVVEVDLRAAGRYYVDIDDDRVLMLDLALLPEHRGRGIGTTLFGQVIADADRRRLPVRLHVSATNPAQRLYRRLGFEVIERGDAYDLMERPWSTSAP
jgi:ribosomal protein S18 acetylase RimI-like enzyme